MLAAGFHSAYFMGQNHSTETDSHLGCQEISAFLLNLKVFCTNSYLDPGESSSYLRTCRNLWLLSIPFLVKSWINLFFSLCLFFCAFLTTFSMTNTFIVFDKEWRFWSSVLCVYVQPSSSWRLCHMKYGAMCIVKIDAHFVSYYYL